MLLSEFLNYCKAKIDWAVQKYFWLLLSIVLLLVVFINGISFVPPEHYFKLAQNPFITRTDISQSNTWQESILLPLVAYYARLTTKSLFHIFCVVVIIAAFALFASLTVKRYDKSISFLVTALLMTSSLVTVLFSWVGTPDGLTVLLSIPLYFTNSLLSLFVVSLLGMANHSMFAFIALEILALRWIAKENGVKLLHLLIVVVGLLTGYGIVQLFLYSTGIVVAPRLTFPLTYSLEHWFLQATNHFPTTLFSLLNIQWLTIVVCIVMFFNADRRFFVAAVLFLFTNGLITFFTLDSTRIFALLSFGVVIESIFHSYDLARGIRSVSRERELGLVLMVTVFLSLFTPRFFVWEGDVVISPFREFLTRLGGYISGR